MGFKVARKILLVGDRFALDRLFHEDGVEDKVAGKNSDREKDDRSIPRQLSGLRRNKVGGHRRGNETIERGHQHTGDDGNDDPLGGDPFLAAHFSIGNGINNDRRGNKPNPRKEQRRVALRRADVVDNHAHDQCDADPDRECDRHASQGNRRHQQNVGCIEHHAAEQRAADIGHVGLLNVGQKAASAFADATERKGKNKRKRHYTDDVVPVEQFKAPILGRQLLGIRPRTPAQHGDHRKGDR